MLKLLILVLILFAIAFGFQRLGDASGEVSLTFGDTIYAVDLTTAVIGAVVIVLIVVGLFWFLRGILGAPWRLARSWRRRNRALGREAISRGLVAIAAGDQRAAERAMLEAARRVPGQPLTRLLQAQTAQLKGDRVGARTIFQEMTEDEATRIAGLRGLYIEAEREGENEAAHQIAARARAEAPSAAWAARALLRHQTAGADWDGALATLAGATDGRILDKRTARRQRAVILTAKALDKEVGEPDIARQAAIEAHDLAADLVPAAVVAGRLMARQGDIRRATRILEAGWRANPHPELAEAYLHVRAGDAASDRLKRAETLNRMRPEADEGRLAVARAAIDARDFARAREILAPLVAERPTQGTLILMGELEEAETGDRGRAREWMARAVYAPRDKAWTADGVVLEAWAPVSPVTGKLDAVEWRVPLAEIEGPRIEARAADLLLNAPPLPAPLAPTAPATAKEIAAPEAAAGPSLPVASPERPELPRPPAANAPRPALVPKPGSPPTAPIEPPRPDDPGVVPDDPEDIGTRQSTGG